ncbi:ATP-binding cassette domain-containing protein [Actinomadura barringtoniae]|uniref:ATP-binding cassette domain-containing protein n=1 Tax=Actinomadura barringtoniae TaxID=1427535 RepID=A0A939PKE1_9ACTN|nr:ATP-binding cassette domain-containing protein [Actinomadura barringtoniae]MBO2453950.1 ATP-binding cassette domain-containing protein [Actinomadura barringtoniae]
MNTAEAPAILVRGLRKSYGDHVVLDGIDLEIPAGTIFSLLGPNGAGKTTTVQILSTLIGADEGTAVVAGHDVSRDPGAVRGSIGVTGQYSAVDKLLTGRENLLMMADLHHLSRREGRTVADRLLEQFDLVEAGKKVAGTYSGGMQRRLDLAMTLVGGPRLIFLDEPTTGLDPRSRRTMWQIVRDLVADGVTIFLTTQYLDEADQLADKLALLDGGKIIAEGTAAELKRRVPGSHVLLRFPDAANLHEATQVISQSAPGTEALTLKVPSDAGLSSLKVLISLLEQESIQVTDLSVHTPDLDDVFLALTGQPTAAADPVPAGAGHTAKGDLR